MRVKNCFWCKRVLPAAERRGNRMPPCVYCGGIQDPKLKREPKELKDILRFLRAERGLRQEDVAPAIYVSTKSYCRYELGDNQPSLSTLVLLADFFSVSCDYLLGREIQKEAM